MVDEGSPRMPSRARSSAIVWVTAVAVAVLLSALARAGDRLPGDLELARLIQDLPGWCAPVAEGVRFATGTRAVLAAGAVLVAGLMLCARLRLGAALLAGLVLLPLVQSSVKDAVDRPRPDPVLVERRAGFTSPSYPSGHVMSGTFLLGFVAVCGWRTRTGAGRTTAAAAVLVAGVNGVANVYEGVHWPSDVAGGYAWAVVVLGVPEAIDLAWRSRSGRPKAA